MSGWSEWSRQWAVAWRFGELSQQPTCPQLMHMRRCTQSPPIRRQSSQPSLEGTTSEMASRWEQVSAILNPPPEAMSVGECEELVNGAHCGRPPPGPGTTAHPPLRTVHCAPYPNRPAPAPPVGSGGAHPELLPRRRLLFGSRTLDELLRERPRLPGGVHHGVGRRGGGDHGDGAGYPIRVANVA